MDDPPGESGGQASRGRFFSGRSFSFVQQLRRWFSSDSAHYHPDLSGRKREIPGAGGWPPGKIIGGHYEIRKILGKGGFGIVFEAVETATKRQVAIKIPLAAGSCGHTGRGRMVSFGWSDFTKQALLKEIRTWMSLVHPHIVEVFDVVDDDSTDYLPAIWYAVL